MKDGLWDVVSGSEPLPDEEHADACRKFMTRSDHAPAIVVLAVDPLLLYLIMRSQRSTGSLAKARRTISPQNLVKQVATTEKALCAKAEGR